MPGRITINPEVMGDKRDALAVAYNEAYRVLMEQNNFEPQAEPTEEQIQFFADTAYANDPLQMKRTITARIATYDTSVPNPTPEQYQDVVDMLNMVIDSGAISNDEEESVVTSTLEDMESKLNGGEAQEATPTMPPEAEGQPLEGDPMAALMGGQAPEGEMPPEGAMPPEGMMPMGEEGGAPADPLAAMMGGMGGQGQMDPAMLEQLMPAGAGTQAAVGGGNSKSRKGKRLTQAEADKWLAMRRRRRAGGKEAEWSDEDQEWIAEQEAWRREDPTGYAANFEALKEYEAEEDLRQNDPEAYAKMVAERAALTDEIRKSGMISRSSNPLDGLTDEELTAASEANLQRQEDLYRSMVRNGASSAAAAAHYASPQFHEAVQQTALQIGMRNATLLDGGNPKGRLPEGALQGFTDPGAFIKKALEGDQKAQQALIDYERSQGRSGAAVALTPEAQRDAMLYYARTAEQIEQGRSKGLTHGDPDKLQAGLRWQGQKGSGTIRAMNREGFVLNDRNEEGYGANAIEYTSPKQFKEALKGHLGAIERLRKATGHADIEGIPINLKGLMKLGNRDLIDAELKQRADVMARRIFGAEGLSLEDREKRLNKALGMYKAALSAPTAYLSGGDEIRLRTLRLALDSATQLMGPLRQQATRTKEAEQAARAKVAALTAGTPALTLATTAPGATTTAPEATTPEATTTTPAATPEATTTAPEATTTAPEATAPTKEEPLDRKGLEALGGLTADAKGGDSDEDVREKQQRQADWAHEQIGGFAAPVDRAFASYLSDTLSQAPNPGQLLRDQTLLDILATKDRQAIDSGHSGAALNAKARVDSLAKALRARDLGEGGQFSTDPDEYSRWLAMGGANFLQDTVFNGYLGPRFTRTLTQTAENAAVKGIESGAHTALRGGKSTSLPPPHWIPAEEVTTKSIHEATKALKKAGVKNPTRAQIWQHIAEKTVGLKASPDYQETMALLRSGGRMKHATGVVRHVPLAPVDFGLIPPKGSAQAVSNKLSYKALPKSARTAALGSRALPVIGGVVDFGTDLLSEYSDRTSRADVLAGNQARENDIAEALRLASSNGTASYDGLQNAMAAQRLSNVMDEESADRLARQQAVRWGASGAGVALGAGASLAAASATAGAGAATLPVAMGYGYSIGSNIGGAVNNIVDKYGPATRNIQAAQEMRDIYLYGPTGFGVKPAKMTNDDVAGATPEELSRANTLNALSMYADYQRRAGMKDETGRQSYVFPEGQDAALVANLERMAPYAYPIQRAIERADTAQKRRKAQYPRGKAKDAARDTGSIASVMKPFVSKEDQEDLFKLIDQFSSKKYEGKGSVWDSPEYKKAVNELIDQFY